MASTLAVTYSKMVNNALVASSSRIAQAIRYLGSSIDVDPRSGTITMPDSTAFTAGTLTEQTIVAGGQANTNTALTVAEYVTAVAIPPSQMYNFVNREGARGVWARQQADALIQQFITLYINALIAATPSQSNTITAGYANFEGATTTELQIWLKTLIDTATNRGGDCSEFICLMYPAAYTNFVGAAAALWNNATIIDGAGMYRVHGCPIVPVKNNTTTYWGAASSSCAFFVHPDGAPLKMAELQVHGGEFHASDDGYYRTILNCVGAYGVKIAALCGEILNDAS